MNKQRMVRMLQDAREAVTAVELITCHTHTKFGTTTEAITEGTQNLIGQLVLASAIENSGSLISDSLDKLDKLAQELGEVASAIRHSS